MKYIKLLISILCILLCTSCSAKDTIDIDKIFETTGQLNNYTNISNSIFNINDNEYVSSTINITKMVNDNIEIDTKTTINDESLSACKLNIENNVIYTLCDGQQPYYYDSPANSYNNMNDLLFKKEDVESYTVNDDVYMFKMKNDYVLNILSQNGLTASKINSLSNTMTMIIHDNVIESQELNIDFDLISFDEILVGTYNYSSIYSDIGNTLYKECDKTIFKEIENAYGIKTLEDFKQALIDELGYIVNDDGNYEITFNVNESYIFDFNNHVFSYIYAGTSYSYNYLTDIGVSQNCIYHFDSENIPNCSEDELNEIKDLRDSFITELSFLGLSEIPQE